MSEMMFCQSCCMPLNDSGVMGTNADGSKNEDYCEYCFKDGKFTSEETMEGMIESCVPHVSNGNPYPDEETARAEMRKVFPQLKRWKNA